MSDEKTVRSVSLQPAISGQLSESERISLYKQYIECEQRKNLKLHREGTGGVEVSKAIALMIDRLLAAILSSVIKTQKLDESPLALVAIGGYGRGTLNPGSDIDLLFLLPRASDKLPKNVQELVQQVLYPLWDVGFKIGHSCRSIAECIQEAKSDQQTSLRCWIRDGSLETKNSTNAF